MAWERSESILDKKDTSTVSVGASQSDSVVSKDRWPLTGEGAERLRVDIYMGFVTAGGGVTATVQDSSGYNIWNDTKTSASITTAAGETFTAATDDIVTDASHGLANGDVVTVSSSGTLPAGLAADTKYWVKVIDGNTFYLHTDAGLSNATRVDITDTGSGTHSYVTPTLYSINFNPEVAGDQTYMPLRNLVRVVLDTGAGSSAQVMDVIVLQQD